MNKTEQGGALQQSRLTNLLIQFLLLIGLCVPHTIYAETKPEETLLAHENNIKKHHLVFIYSPDSTLQTDITQSLSEILLNKDPNIVISTVTPEDKTLTTNRNPDIIIAVGLSGIQSAKKHYPRKNKLFIATEPEKLSLDTGSNKGNAILYMAQPYCRQIHFIRQLNDRWKVIGLLNSQEKLVNTHAIQLCANKYGMKIYSVNTTNAENLTNDIKNALNHSDILLALPDKNIYNSKTVKNILLTSYRYRKPVIAFSQNFVNAGALASIHSSAEQIARSASRIIEQYFKRNHQFKKSVNHPLLFDISINRQVFRALDLSAPDLDKLKQTLEHPGTDKSGELQ